MPNQEEKTNIYIKICIDTHIYIYLKYPSSWTTDIKLKLDQLM